MIGREKKIFTEEDGIEVTVFPSDSHILTIVNKFIKFSMIFSTIGEFPIDLHNFLLIYQSKLYLYMMV